MTTARIFAYDLHVHTINSDGDHSPEEVIDMASESGIKGIVLTDHSGVTFNPALRQYAREKNVDLPFPGTEVSTIHEGRKHHILCFGYGVLDRSFQEWIRYPTNIRNVHLKNIVDELRRAGIDIPPMAEMLQGISPHGYRHKKKWMMRRSLIASYVKESLGCSEDEARALFMKGYEAFGKRIVWLEEEKSESQRFLSTVDVIRYARRLNIVTVLAHPFWWSKDDPDLTEKMFSQLETFIAAGLSGVEARTTYPPRLPAHVEFEEWATDRKLLISGGSDFHKTARSHLGQHGIDFLQFSRIAQLAGKAAQV